ncbi:hypothetical protein H4R99_005584 [Coemansia sp. RSA 1722]|nr:hypothetical protein LPJ57_006350 [Coemansia sp. RSA 486]KAJ2220976.1 hypothetical protein IWW45_008983 [Coemansia sp. RSA 485]KAJ2594849.1 hypothetical protein H4R99_005584 [Coemansia sp. RSA 1722]KAJ2600191.1 hypothetical protein GGF39_001896 [Coemansia sp. RSA 1721]
MHFGGLSREEILRGAANRLLYSKFYTYYYIGMFLLGLISLVTAILESCPSVFFITIESILCICMMLEIITRAIAMHMSFLTSWWNYFDIVIVMFCGITLILLSRECSAGSNSEELLNTVMLVIRNAAQVFRLMATLRKNRRQMAAQDVNVSLDDGAAVLGFIEDMDGLGIDGEAEYHVPAFQNQADSAEVDFRLSIDSVGDELHEHAPGIDRTDSRSSATSLRSTPDRLTGRKRGNGSN